MAVKNAAAHVRKLSALLKQLQKLPMEPWQALDPISQVVMGFLEWNATARSAQAAYGRLMQELVDHNDLRVSHVREVVALIGPKYPRVEERAARLHDVLQAIYEREHAMTLAGLEKRSRRDVRQYLDSLPGMVPYVAAQVSLCCFGAGGMPVDDIILGHLQAQGIVEPATTVIQAEHFLEKHIESSEAVEMHRRLRAWADGLAGSESAGARGPARRDGQPAAQKRAQRGKGRGGQRS